MPPDDVNGLKESLLAAVRRIHAGKLKVPKAERLEYLKRELAKIADPLEREACETLELSIEEETFLPQTSPDGNPLGILRAAIQAVPAVKYALGIAGIAAAIAIIGGFKIDYRVAVFGVIIMFVLMVVLVLFAKLSKASDPTFATAGKVFLWFSLVLVIAVATFLTTSVFFSWPRDLGSWLGQKASGRARREPTRDVQAASQPPQNDNQQTSTSGGSTANPQNSSSNEKQAPGSGTPSAQNNANAPSGIAITGGTVTNPTVNNYATDSKTLETLLGNEMKASYTFIVKDSSTATHDAGVLRANPPTVFFSRGEVPCPIGFPKWGSTDRSYLRKADVEPDAPNVNISRDGKQAIISWQVSMNVWQSTTKLRGAAQIPGATIVIATTGYGDDEMTLLDADIDFLDGFEFSIPANKAAHTETSMQGPPNMPTLPLKLTNYCYVFPANPS
jgi:hypothetical protein